MHIQYKDCRLTLGLAEEFLATVHAILKNYRKYRQHGTSLNRNKVNSRRYRYIVIKGEIKDKKL